MFAPLMDVIGLWTLAGLLVAVTTYGGFVLWKYLSRRRANALLAAVVDHYIHDRVQPDKKHFEKDTSRIAKKAWKFSDFARLQKRPPEPQFEALLVGATNKCFKVTFPTESHGLKRAFMRVQGAGSVLSNPREQELAIFQYASTYKLGPRLYSVFDNGYVAEFMTGKVVAVDALRDPKMMERIAKLVANWHSLSIPSTVAAKRLIQWKGRKPLRVLSLAANTWAMIDKWLVRAKRLYASEDAIALCTGKSATFCAFQAELSSTKRDLLPFYGQESSIVLCHNDLNHGNLLYDSESDSLLAVDLEFAGINHRGFDLGNHFCEWAGLELHYDNCPNMEQMKSWISVYLDHLTISSPSNKQQHIPYLEYMKIPKSQLMEEIAIEATKWMQASHLFWWLWAMIQIKISNIEGFDATNYAQVRWQQYMKNKEATQALEHPQRLLSNVPSYSTVYPCTYSKTQSHSRRRSSSSTGSGLIKRR